VAPNLRRRRAAGDAVLSLRSRVEQATLGHQEPASPGGPDGETTDASEPRRPPRRSSRGGGGVSGERREGSRDDVAPTTLGGAGARGGIARRTREPGRGGASHRGRSVWV
jgi:hypothetical protein